MQLHSRSPLNHRARIFKAYSRIAYLPAVLLIPLLYPLVAATKQPQQSGQSAGSDATQNAQLSENVGTPQTWTILDQLATEAISKDKLFLGRARFTISKANGTYSYDSAPVPASSVLGADDQYGKLLESLIRIKALRRDFESAVPDATFWAGPLEGAEKAVQNCVRKLDSSKLSAQAAQQCESTVEASFANLDQVVHDYAVGNRLQLVQWRKRDPAQGYKVTIKLSPEKAHLYLMPLFEYKKCHYPGSPVQACQWNEVLSPDVEMIGWYHYRADWPRDLNGPVEGDFEVTAPGTFTFTPKNQ